MAGSGTDLTAERWGPAAQGRPRHLVVLVHGYGADGSDLIALAPVLSRTLPDAVFAAPHAPEPCAESPLGRQWFPLWDRTPEMLAAGVGPAAAALDRFLDAELARLGLAPDAYALMGFSQGAMTVLHSGLRRSPPPRAILAFSGALLAADALPGAIRHRPPVLLVHGDADPVVPVEASRIAARQLRDAGVEAELTIASGLGHVIDEAGIALATRKLERAFADQAA